jgi:hypothetical protein
MFAEMKAGHDRTAKGTWVMNQKAGVYFETKEELG